MIENKTILELKNKRYDKILNELGNLMPKTKNEKITIDTYKLIPYAILSKYIKSVKSIYILDMNGFYEDAKIILRTVYEILVILLYCNIEPQKNYTRYKKYRCVTIKNYIDMLSDDELKKITDIAINYNRKELEEYKEIYGENKNNLKYWNGISFKNTVKKVNEYYEDEDIYTLYNLLYQLNCEEVHSDINTIIKNYLEITDSDILMFKCDPQKKLEYIDIIEKLENITSKLKYIKFDYII